MGTSCVASQVLTNPKPARLGPAASRTSSPLFPISSLLTILPLRPFANTRSEIVILSGRRQGWHAGIPISVAVDKLGRPSPVDGHKLCCKSSFDKPQTCQTWTRCFAYFISSVPNIIPSHNTTLEAVCQHDI